MTEATLTAGLLKTLRAAFPMAAIFKHNDSSTGGIPDISITVGGRIFWLEIKHWKDGRVSQWSRGRHARQHLTCRQLFGASSGRCFYVIYNTRDPALGKRILILTPGQLAADYIWGPPRVANDAEVATFLRERIDFKD